MSANRLQRTYILRGLDRILYRSEPRWAEGTFVQSTEEEGRLVLLREDINSVSKCREAVRIMDQQAERFRLAIARRIGCPLMLKLEKSEEPNFDPLDLLSVTSAFVVSDHAEATVLPADAPNEIEQLPEAAARWVQTLTETRSFSGHPDESLKRLYLLIEELYSAYYSCLTDDQRSQLPEMKWVRDFVSHPVCRNPELCAFIEHVLPSAVISTDPLAVQFDRTLDTHRNFVARVETKARDLVQRLLTAAIEGLIDDRGSNLA
jgi:hypothetical protein